MVKLVRITTQDTTGLFENVFNEDIIIEKNSKVALHSMTCEISNQQIIIDAQNDVLFSKFTSSGQYKECHLQHGTYNASDFQNLLSDATVKLNRTSVNNQTDIGRQWEVSIPQATKKVTFNSSLGTFIQAENGSPLMGLKNVIAGLPATSKSFIRNGGVPTTDDAFMWFKSPNCKGSSTFSAQIGASSTTGFVLAYLLEPPDATTLTINPANIVYGIRHIGTVSSVGNNPISRYKIYNNGVQLVDPTYFPVVGDYLSLETGEGKISGKIYRGDNTFTLFTFDYDHVTNLFPVVIFNGDANAVVAKIHFNTDPFYNIQNTYTTSNEIEVQGTPTGPSTAVETIKFLKFGDIDLALLFGFDKLELRSKKSKDPITLFEAKDIFRMADLVDSFVLELLNIPLDSYDGLTNQRRNILHTIVQTDMVRERLTYTAPYPLYINMNNANILSLREVRARLLREDLSRVTLNGFSQITLLISE